MMDVNIDAVVSEYVKKSTFFSPEQVKEKLEQILSDIAGLSIEVKPVSGSSVEMASDFHGCRLEYLVNKSNKDFATHSIFSTIISHHVLTQVFLPPGFRETVETHIRGKIPAAFRSISKSDFAQKKIECAAKEKERKIECLRAGVREQLKLAINGGLAYDDLKQILDEELVRFVQD